MAKSIFLTGANGGIGAALVPRLLENGWTVYAGVSESKTLPEHANVKTVPMDVTNSDSIAAAATAVADACGNEGLQALLNLAGIIVQGPLEILPESELRRQFDVNVFGSFSVMQQFLPLIRKGKGRIINVTAASALVALPFVGAISASKAALAFLSDTFRMELSRWDIPVIDVLPGSMRTGVFRKAQEAFEQSLQNVPEAGKELYKDMIDGAAAAAAKRESQLGDPKIVAEAILEALESAHPEPEYFVGPDAVMAKRDLQPMPIAQRDTLLATLMGIA